MQCVYLAWSFPSHPPLVSFSMEIYRAIADFSEDLVLAYLRERSEAVGIPCKFSVFEDGGDDGRGSSSDEDRAFGREGEHEARTWRERDSTEDEAVLSVCVRVKDRARSIDSGVCVETKRENGRGRKTTTENGGREWLGSEAEACGGGGGGYGGGRVSCRAEGGGQEVCKYDSEAAGYCVEGSGHLLETHTARDSASSLVLAFRRGDLFGVSNQGDSVVVKGCSLPKCVCE